MSSPSSRVPPDQRDLVVALAGLTLQRSAPEELAVLETTATEYFEDPAAVLSSNGRDERLGLGLDVALLAPYALAVAAAVVHVVLAPARAPAESTLEPAFDGVLHRRVGSGAEDPPPVDAATARRLHEVAVDRGTALGLDPARATLLADSLVGALTASS